MPHHNAHSAEHYPHDDVATQNTIRLEHTRITGSQTLRRKTTHDDQSFTTRFSHSPQKTHGVPNSKLVIGPTATSLANRCGHPLLSKIATNSLATGYTAVNEMRFHTNRNNQGLHISNRVELVTGFTATRRNPWHPVRANTTYHPLATGYTAANEIDPSVNTRLSLFTLHTGAIPVY